MFEAIVKHVEAPKVDADGPLQMQVSSLDYDPYVGVLGIARIAGIMASKRTSDLIPLCHPIGLTHVELNFEIQQASNSVSCEARTETRSQTGVEMEALTAVQVALLTIYDMCKAIDRGMEMSGIRLLAKSGGKSGDWKVEN